MIDFILESQLGWILASLVLACVLGVPFYGIYRRSRRKLLEQGNPVSFMGYCWMTRMRWDPRKLADGLPPEEARKFRRLALVWAIWCVLSMVALMLFDS